MPAWLALQWERDAIRGLEAESTASGLRVRQSFVLPWPADVDRDGDPQLVGAWLADEFERRNVGTRSVLVSLPREDVVLRQMQLPQASDAALPDLVRYQAAARSAVPLDQLALDFVPQPPATAGEGRQVLAATAATRLVTRIRDALQAAGREPAAIGVSSLALAALADRLERGRGEATPQNCLLVLAAGQRIEVLLLRADQLLFSHHARPGDAPLPDVVWGEVQRGLLAHQDVVGDEPPARVWLIAPPPLAEPLRERLSTQLDRPVVAVNPFAELADEVHCAAPPEDPAQLAAALGASLHHAQPTTAEIDFLHPRQAPVAPNRTKRYLAAAAAAVLVFVGLLYGGTRLYRAALENQITEIQRQEEQLDADIEQQRAVVALSELLDGWENRRGDWLDEMQRIGRALPDNQRLYLQRWRFDEARGDVAGTVAAAGFARDRRDVEALYQRLAEQPGFAVRPNPIRENVNETDYPVQFELDIELTAPAPQADAGREE